MPTRDSACSWDQVPPYLSAMAYSVAIQYGSVSTSVPSMSHSTAAGAAEGRDSVIGVVAEVRGEPLLGLLQAPALALGVRRHLVAAQPPDDEVLALGVAVVEP